MVAHRERLEPDPAVPERLAHRHQLERVPEVHPALGEHVGVVGHAPVQQRDHRRRHVQPDPPAARRVEPRLHEQPLEAGDVVQVGVGDEQGFGRRAVVLQAGGQPLAAAVDGQPGPAVALDRGHGRAELHGVGVADAVQLQVPAVGRMVHQQPRSHAPS